MANYTIIGSAFLMALGLPTVGLGQDCKGASVGFAEVNAALGAGFTDESLGVYRAANGEDVRGFIEFDSGSGFACKDDWVLVSYWFVCEIGGNNGLSAEEAQSCSNSLAFGTFGDFAIFESISIYVDDVHADSIRTGAQVAAIPELYGGGLGATAITGALFEPGALSPGTHSATVNLRFSPEFCEQVFGASYPCGNVTGITDFDVIGDNGNHYGHDD